MITKQKVFYLTLLSLNFVSLTIFCIVEDTLNLTSELGETSHEFNQKVILGFRIKTVNVLAYFYL